MFYRDFTIHCKETEICCINKRVVLKLIKLDFNLALQTWGVIYIEDLKTPIHTHNSQHGITPQKLEFPRI